MSKVRSLATKKSLKRFVNSIWLFPVVAALAVIGLTALQISGSSIGVYHQYLYGNTVQDPDLLLNKPRPIRSDEWLTNTQLAIAQKENGFQRINENIGNGQNMSVIVDAPRKDWSSVFKPHDAAFYVLPVGYALAFKWWFMAYLLLMASYFFVLFLLPGRRLLATCLALALLFSPFVQWWYQFVTLGSMYYSLFIALACGYLLRAKKASQAIVAGVALSYLLVSFVLVFYPPFQIACGLVTAAFVLGYFLERLPKLSRRQLLSKLGIFLAASAVAGLLVFVFLNANSQAIEATQNSAYPGNRVVPNGGFDASRFFSTQLAFPFQKESYASNYYFPTRGISNQSEASNFLYLMPFLVLPGALLVIRRYRAEKTVDWPLVTTMVLFGIFIVRLFVFHYDALLKPLLLHSVPHHRLLIGTGLLGMVYTVLIIRALSHYKKALAHKYLILAYSIAVLLFEIFFGLIIMHRAPGFINPPMLVLLALPFPVIIYLLLTKRFVPATAVLLLFSLASTMFIHPLYRGTEIVSDTPISQRVRQLAAEDDGRWVTEGFLLQHFALMNGARSLTGTYTYPQLALWKDIPGAAAYDYNRFAHVDFKIDRNPGSTPTSLELEGGDSFTVKSEACSQYLKNKGVRFILTEEPLTPEASCARLVDTIPYPARTFYIYHLDQ